jgi:nucleoside-diphosphate kinase
LSNKEIIGKNGVERTVVMVRPHVILNEGFDAVQDVKNFYLKEPDLKIIKSLRLTFTRQKAAEFYVEHKGKFFFENLLDTTTVGESVLLLIEGPDAIARVREINGPTDPRKNRDKKTIRGKYGIKVGPEATDCGSENAVHSSDSPTSAMREEKIIWGSIKGL